VEKLGAVAAEFAKHNLEVTIGGSP